MIAKAFLPYRGTKPFVIMKCLLKSHARKSHPPPQAHFPRVPGTFLADRIIVGRYPRYVRIPYLPEFWACRVPGCWYGPEQGACGGDGAGAGAAAAGAG